VASNGFSELSVGLFSLQLRSFFFSWRVRLSPFFSPRPSDILFFSDFSLLYFGYQLPLCFLRDAFFLGELHSACHALDYGNCRFSFRAFSCRDPVEIDARDAFLPPAALLLSLSGLPSLFFSKKRPFAKRNGRRDRLNAFETFLSNANVPFPVLLPHGMNSGKILFFFFCGKD